MSYSLLCFCGIASAATLVPFGSGWSYHDDGCDSGTAWREPAFDDSSWSRGAGQLGYGDGDEATVVTPHHVTYYFRHVFHIDAERAVGTASMNLIYDDGAVVYLNGVEVYRTELLPAFGDISYDQGTSVASPDNQLDSRISIGVEHFKHGVNVIAVEVHNSGKRGSGLSFDFNLSVEVASPPGQHVRRYQQGAEVGVDGWSVGPTYFGQTDVELWEVLPDTNYDIGSNMDSLTVDGEDEGGPKQVVMRFDDIIGGQDWQVPPGAVIDSASLRLTVINRGASFTAQRLAETVLWEGGTATWSNFSAGGGGVQVESDLRGASQIVNGSVGIREFDITDMVTAWVDGAANRGFALLPDGADGVGSSQRIVWMSRGDPS